MYSRKISTPPESIIKNGRAEFGTYKGISQKLDIKGMRAPYAGLPLPSFISRWRIKSRLDYLFQTEKFIGMTEFFDLKVFGTMQVIFWDKQTGKKYSYFCFMGPRKRIIPVYTTAGTCVCSRKTRYSKVFWGRNHEHLAMKFNVKGDANRPDANASFFSPAEANNHTDHLFVNPSPASSRCSATWFSTMEIQGKVNINGKEEDNSKGIAALAVNRTYIKFHSISTHVWGMGKIKDKNVVFQLRSSNLDAADQDRYNENILIIDGKETALPSIVITHPFGINKSWIIQDTESMVDLTFEPVSINTRARNIIAMRTSYTTIYGNFTGVLLDSDGNKINLKNFPGIINRNLLRL